jgi:Neurotransmitter-gated ion-channel ligand binding domain/Neurotransmitter-gated ion-channel transmembrane region
MSKRFYSALLVSILVRSIQLASGAEIPPLIDRPNADSGPTEISVGMWMTDISSIDSAQETFTAEIAVVLRWKDPRLVHTGNGVVRYPLEQIWHPRVGIVNETNSVSRKMPDSVEVDPKGMVTYRQRYVGAFTQPLRLQSFPFDRQTFRVQLVAVRYQSNEVKFVPDQDWLRDGIKDAGGISPSVTLPDWTVEKWELKPLVYALAPHHQYSSYAFEFTAARNVSHYILKVMFPLVLIVIMSWAVFWMDPIHSNSQISIAITSMLTLIAYRFSTDNQLPRLPYMTRLDAFILMGTVLIFFSLIEVITTTILETNHRAPLAKTIDRCCRLIFPVIFVSATFAIFAHPRG